MANNKSLTLHQFFQSPLAKPAGALALFALGAALLILGGVLLLFGFRGLSGSKGKPGEEFTPTTSAQRDQKTSEESGGNAVEGPPVWETRQLRLEFDQVWRVSSLDRSETRPLPGFLPRPPLFDPPGRPLSPAELSHLVLGALQDQGIELNEARLAALANFRIAGIHPLEIKGFRDRAAMLEGSSKDSRGSPTASPETSDGEERGFPAAIDPRTALFKENLLQWKRGAREPLRLAQPQKRGLLVTLSHPESGADVAMFLSAKALERIRQPDFGKSRRDHLIYLQALANQYGATLLVDGYFGPNSKRGLSRLPAEAFGRSELKRSYQDLLDAYF